MSDFLEQPELTDHDKRAILRWADLKPESHPLLAAGGQRNAERHATAWGLKLLATLLQECPGIDPGQDPVEALHAILDRQED